MTTGLEVIDLLELEGFGVGRAGHSRQPVVHPEIILEGDRGERLVLALDRHAFLRLDGLVQSVGPPASRHQSSGEFVDDDHFAVLDDVVLVAVEQRMRAQRRVEMMDEPDVVGIVEARTRGDETGRAEQVFDVLVAFLGKQRLVRLLVDPVVARPFLVRLAAQARHDLVQPVIHVDVVVGLTRDDERRARLVDQDGIDLVDDGVTEPALDALGRRVDHVVAQIIEAELVVGAVGDVGGVGDLLVGVRHLGEIDADRESEEAVDPPHPVRVALREVVVDRDDVHTPPGERIEIGGKGRDQRLAFAGAHFRDLAVVERDAADQLHVEMAHGECAFAGLADEREGFRQHRLERLAVAHPRAQSRRAVLEVGIGERRDRRFERVDLANGGGVLPEQALVAAAENAGQDVRNHRS